MLHARKLGASPQPLGRMTMNIKLIRLPLVAVALVIGLLLVIPEAKAVKNFNSSKSNTSSVSGTEQYTVNFELSSKMLKGTDPGTTIKIGKKGPGRVIGHVVHGKTSITGVAVSLKRIPKGKTLTVKTDRKGNYVFNRLAPGTYKLHIAPVKLEPIGIGEEGVNWNKTKTVIKPQKKNYSRPNL